MFMVIRHQPLGLALENFVNAAYAANTKRGMLATSGFTTAGESAPSPMVSKRMVARAATAEGVRGMVK